MLTSVCKLITYPVYTQSCAIKLISFAHTAFIIMLSNISMGTWNPICSQRFLTGHLSIGGALYEPSTFCQIQGQQEYDFSKHLSINLIL